MASQATLANAAPGSGATSQAASSKNQTRNNKADLSKKLMLQYQKKHSIYV